MNRRHFIALGSATLILPTTGLSAAPLDYTPGMVEDRLAKGETVFLDFKASWCSTCKAQEKVLTKLKAANPAYEQAVTFVNVDWDDYGKSDLARSLRIPRRSTLVVLKGNREIGRLVAETREGQIKMLMDAALGAATA
ncbi:thioredoxin [Oceanicola sp. 22II-s10i]|uniref:thioredoxin family protein n=1 Tax=Oceanicola sp. 22II-s10i TaxID=1317116 RepID=UPI000B52732B|nr:thioredoxin family protein [Oceanicola sp. 22II-s10i]OWU86316.1 thioredoxin [Oceanicola sp. 22II-s10i]